MCRPVARRGVSGFEQQYIWPLVLKQASRVGPPAPSPEITYRHVRCLLQASTVCGLTRVCAVLAAYGVCLCQPTLTGSLCSQASEPKGSSPSWHRPSSQDTQIMVCEKSLLSLKRSQRLGTSECTSFRTGRCALFSMSTPPAGGKGRKGPVKLQPVWGPDGLPCGTSGCALPKGNTGSWHANSSRH